MKNLFYAVLALAIVIFSSCSNEDNTTTENTDKVAAKFTSSIGTGSEKVNGASWSLKDSITIYMKTAGAELNENSIAPQWHPFIYKTTNGDGVFAPVETDDIFYLPQDKKVDFVSFYPCTALSDKFKLMIYSGTMDFMMSTNATNISSATPNVNLNFKHKMSKVVFNIVPGSGLNSADLANLDISISSIYLTGEYSLTTNKFIALGDRNQYLGGGVIMDKDGLSGYFNIIPQTIDEYYDSRLDFFMGGANSSGGIASHHWPIPKGTTFEEGKKYTYNITLNKSSLSVNSQITDWVAEDPINVVVN